LQIGNDHAGRIMNTQLSIGVIGHVDHGKTALVRALTGMETDRLKEEKERGMSIVLGFAHLRCSAGEVDLIDVPGHENFIRTMVAGASGIDAALLVIDIKEGVKPQTAEHLAITELIGVRHGLIVLTKTDLASEEECAAALVRLRLFLKGTYLESAPAFFTSVRTGDGLDEVRQAMACLLENQSMHVPSGKVYLPIDRAFSMAGHGTIVTGTLRLGPLRVGDELEIMPHGRLSTVRQLQVHNREASEGFPGQRVGVNLRNVKTNEIVRGDALASIGLLRPSTLFDARLTLLKNQRKVPITGQPLRLLSGTTDVITHVRLLSGDAIEPGGAGIVQLRTARPVTAIAGEPFILRSDSPSMTIGGGRFLDCAPARHRRSDAAAMTRLQVLAGGSFDEIIVERLKAAGFAGIAVTALAAAINRPVEEVQPAAARSGAMVNDKRMLYRPHLETLGSLICEVVESFHRQHPTRSGMPLASLRAMLPDSVDEPVFGFALRTVSANQRVEVRHGLARRFGFDPFDMLGEADRQLAFAVESAFRQGSITPPDMEEVLRKDARRADLFHLFLDRGSLIALKSDQSDKKIVFHRDAVSEACRKIKMAYPPPAEFSVSEARVLLGSTRKYIVPLLEHLDAAGHTRRRGDKRMVVGEDGKGN
jgi:selenocysteine-specific elongation factor